jgi:iron complex outermembrane receptor protein
MTRAFWRVTVASASLPACLRGASLAAITAAILWAAPGLASAQTTTADTSTTATPPPKGEAAGKTDTVVSEVLVTGARNLTGVIEKQNGDVAFGIAKPLVDTPRSLTAVSDLLLDRYDIKTVYDITEVAAGTYTGSYFGVPGSLNVRGRVADNYFNGFQEITNFATYPTPVDASSSIDVVRGPPSPAYGAGQVGGYMNFIPKSQAGVNAPAGAASLTFGSYNQKEATVEGGTPFMLGDHQAGVYGFLELVDSDSYYIGEHPQSQTLQVTFNIDLGHDWSFSATAQYLGSSGYLKDIGWNRVTQSLINNGTYVSGTAMQPMVQPGQAFITVADFNAAAAKYGPPQQYVLPLFGIFASPNPLTELNPATVRMVQLSPRQTDISPDDINVASTPTFYAGLTRTFGDTGTLKLESYTQYLDALNYQSYGFATEFISAVNEERISYLDKRSWGDNLALQTLVGASYRYTNSMSDQYLLNEVNVQDRYDLSQPQTPDEIFNAVFAMPNHDGYQWDNATTSRQTDLGFFLMEDALLFGHLDITGGVRDDTYWLSSIDTGPLADANGAPYAINPATGLPEAYTLSGHYSPISYNISASIENPWAVPYVTYAHAYSLNVDQGDAIIPELIYDGNALGLSTLEEVGLKTSQFGGRLYGAIDFYRQENQYLGGHGAGVQAELGQGFEGELRYLVNQYLGITGTITDQHVDQLGAGGGSGTFTILTPAEAGITGVQGYGGMFETNAEFLGLANGFRLHTTPRLSGSLFATFDYHKTWGLTGGFNYNSWTGGSIPGSIRLPAYTLVKAGAYVMFKGVRADFYVDNLFDQRYFIAEYDVDANATVLPGIGREFHFKLSKKF